MFHKDSLNELPISYQAHEIAKILNVSKSYVYKILKSGELPHYEVGGRKVIARIDFLSWLESKRRQG